MTSNVVLNARVISKKLIHENLMILKVGFLEGAVPVFKPGQFGTLGLLEEHNPKGKTLRLIRRSYSIASSAEATDYAEYFITRVSKGLFTTRLFGLREGDLLWMAKKITGFFTLDPIPCRTHIIWMATGTGVAPFVSMLRSSQVMKGRENSKIALLHGVRYVSDLGYEGELRAMASRRENFFYFPIVSRHESGWCGSVGRLQSLWQDGVIEEGWGFSPSSSDTHVMLCGNPYMIKEMLVILENLGFSIHSRRQSGNIHFEKYWNEW